MRRALLLLLVLVVGCDRRSGGPRSAVKLPTRQFIQLSALAQLPPGRTVHLTVDALGNAFCTVEAENGQDGVIVASESALPRSTRLTTANILAAMGETVGGDGTIQDLAPGPAGTIYFFFVGGKGRSVKACIGQYTFRTESIRVVFDTNALTAASGMGASLGLARGRLLPVGEKMLLLLRHTDSWGLFGFNAKGPGPGVELKLTRELKSIQADQDQFDLTGGRYELYPGPSATLLLLDRKTGDLWEVNHEGSATPRTRLSGLPRDLSPLLLKQDHLLFFAADSEPFEQTIDYALRQRLPQTSFPALLEMHDEQFTAIGRDDLRVPSGFPAYAMRFTALVQAPDQSLVGYDASSGKLMHIRVVSEQN